MAKKKAKASRRGGRSSKPDRELSEFDLFPPELLLQGAMEQILGGLHVNESELQEGRSLALLAKAMASSGAKRAKFAREAIRVWPNCAPAYVLLADEAATPREALQLYTEGMTAAAALIEPQFFANPGEEFEFLPESQVYLSARMGVANMLWLLGESAEALDHYREILRLAPSDEQGTRYVLASRLAGLGHHEELGELLDRYDEESAEWLYTRALLAFVRRGDSPEANDALRAAIEQNPHVPPLLVGDALLPEAAPEVISPGSEAEAAAYAAAFLSGWRNTHGAVTWLRRASKLGLPKMRETAPDLDELLELASLPQVEGEVWQADVVRLPQSPPRGTPPAERFWAILVTCAADEHILAFELTSDRPDDAQLWSSVLSAIGEPVNGEPHRPAAIEFSTKKRVKGFEDDLREMEIECLYRKPLDDLLRIASHLERALPGQGVRQQTRGELRPDVLLALPQEDEVWEVDISQMPTWVDTEEGPIRPWVTLIADAESGAVVGHNVSIEHPSHQETLALVAQSAASPMVGSPHRPSALAVRSEDHRSALHAFLNEAGIRCYASDRLEAVDQARSGLAKRMGETGIPSLIESGDLEPHDVGELYEAAGEFYRRTPWREVPGDTVIRLKCDELPGGPWYAIVMGQIGIVVGLAVYDDLPLLQGLITGRISQEEHAHRAASLSVMFDEEFAVPAPDLEAAEQFGWPVVAPEAYPTAMHVGRRRSLRAPDLRELRLLQAALRVIPRFLESKDRSPRELVVPTSRGEVRLRVDIPHGK